MGIQRRKVTARLERHLATGLIISDRFLREIKSVYNAEHVQTPYVKQIAAWAFAYFEKYQAAPKKHIGDIFQKARADELDPDIGDLIEDFLAEISDQYDRSEQFNVDYVLDQLEGYFASGSIKTLATELNEAVEAGDLDHAKKAIADYRIPQRTRAAGINPFLDSNAIEDAFDEEAAYLFKMPGALGEMINGELYREGFLAFLGREKIGKTWTLMEFGIRAYRDGCNVAFFQAGDMTQKQQVRRMHIRVAGKSNLERFCGTVLSPVMDCQKNQDDSCDLSFRTCDFGVYEEVSDDDPKKKKKKLIKKSYEEAKEEGYTPCTKCLKKPGFMPATWLEEVHIEKPLTVDEAKKAGIRFAKQARGGDFKLSTYPGETLTVEMIWSQLEQWALEDGFIPDVLLVDYADIMTTPKFIAEERHRQNTIWKGLSALRQYWHCLLITVTQADASSYSTASLSLDNYSEDKRKYGHVTAFYSLNQTPEEAEAKVMRIGQLIVREGECNINREVAILQCLQRGKAYLKSFWTWRKEENKKSFRN